MDKFQVYNRELNTWEDNNIELISGWNENFVLDKTTDNASIKLKYKSNTAPNWNINDWCRILHLNDNETGATYTRQNVVGDEVPIEKFFFYERYVNYNNYTMNFEFRFNRNFIEQQPLDARIIIKYNILGAERVDNLSYIFSDGENGYRIEYSQQFQNFEEIDSYQFISLEFVPYNIQYVRVSGGYSYIPLNHDQYLIRDISMVEDKVNSEIDIQLTLVEPINITNGILCETMSFTNQTQKIIDDKVYTHRKLNHLSVLEKILKVTPANNDSYEDGYDRTKNKSWYNRFKIVDKFYLQDINFNDETYSEPSLYEILLNKYDSSVGRTPVVYFDINGTTDLPYNTNRDDYVLRFERQDGLDKEEIELSTLLDGAKDVVTNKSGDNFTDGLVSNYNNLSPNSKIYTPSETLWLVPEVDTLDRDTTIYANETDIGKWVLKTPHIIKKVNSVKRFYIYSRVNTDLALYYVNKEILQYPENKVLEEKQYNTSSFYNQKTNVAWYKEGSNIIHLNEVLYDNISSGFDNIGRIWVYKVEYEPLISGRFDLSQDYNTAINQIDSQVDNYKLGKYLLEYLNSMNKSDYIITKTVENYKDIKEIGSRVINGDKVFLITNVSIQNRGFEYDAVYQLNENHIRRSDNVQAPQEIRKNIEIGIDATKERKSMLSFDIGFSFKEQNKEFYNTDLRNIAGLNEVLSQSLSIITKSTNENFIQLANFDFKSDMVRGNGLIEKNVISRLCEIAKYYIGNTICFNMRYFDNADAGKNKTLDSHTIMNITLQNLPKQQLPILYTNGFGEFDTFNVKFIKTSNKDITEIEPDIDISNTNAPASSQQIEAMRKYLNEINVDIQAMATYPLTTSIPQEDLDNPIASIENIQYYKDMLDTFNYTIGFNFKTDKDLILCKQFFENNALLSKEYSTIETYNIYDVNLTENDISTAKRVGWGNINSVNETYYDLDEKTISKIDITTNNNLDNAKSIVIFANNVPILIINNLNTTGKTFSLYHS